LTRLPSVKCWLITITTHAYDVLSMHELHTGPLEPLLEGGESHTSEESPSPVREISPTDLSPPRAASSYGWTPPRPEHTFSFASEEQVYVRFLPSWATYHSWWWTFLRLRYAFLFAMVFITAAIYMLSMQSQLLLRAFYRTGDVFQTRSLDWELLKSFSKHPLPFLELVVLCICLATTPLLAAILLHTLRLLISDAWSEQCCPAYRALIFKLLYGIVVSLPGWGTIPSRLRRAIVRLLAVVGDVTVMCLDIVPCTYGIMSGLGGGQVLYDAAQVYLRTMVVTAYLSAALFVALQWGNSVRIETALFFARIYGRGPHLAPSPASPGLSPAGKHDKEASSGDEEPGGKDCQETGEFVSLDPRILHTGHATCCTPRHATCRQRSDPSFLRRELLLDLSSAWYKRPSQRQLMEPIQGSWRVYTERRLGASASTASLSLASSDAELTAHPGDFLVDLHGPQQSANQSLAAKGHFKISYDHPAYGGRLGVTAWHGFRSAAVEAATASWRLLLMGLRLLGWKVEGSGMKVPRAARRGWAAAAGVLCFVPRPPPAAQVVHLANARGACPAGGVPCGIDNGGQWVHRAGGVLPQLRQPHCARVPLLHVPLRRVGVLRAAPLLPTGLCAEGGLLLLPQRNSAGCGHESASADREEL